MERKYLEYFDGAFDSTVADKMKPENKPYVAYSKTEGVAYTVVPAKEQPSLYEAVDLGLPSGLKWANMNVGATSLEDAGLYFQWGDTVGYTKEQVEAGEKVFNWNTYWDTNDGGSTFNKYNNDGESLKLEDDIAAQIMGSEWSTPSMYQFQELINNTTPTFIDLQGNEYTQEEAKKIYITDGNLKGIRLTSSNGNSIFIPANGICIDTKIYNMNSTGNLSSRNLYEGYPAYCKFLNFNSSGSLSQYEGDRYCGLSVRGVKA